MPPPAPANAGMTPVGDVDENMAVQLRFALITSVAIGPAVGAQAPPQPRNDPPGDGVAVKITCVPDAYVSEQSEFADPLQEVPGTPVPVGSPLVTVPLPVTATVSWNVLGVVAPENIAVQFRFAFITTVAIGPPAPAAGAQAPPQPRNDPPGDGVAVKITGVPDA